MHFLSIIHITIDNQGDTMSEMNTNIWPQIPKSQHSCVTQYVVSDPNNVKNGGYKFWAGCKYTPVAYDNQDVSGGYRKAINLPSFWVQPFLATLKKSNPDVRKDPMQRLISVIKLNEDYKLYVIPDLTGKYRYIIAGDTPARDWLYYMTPAIRTAIVEQMKIRSRR